MIFERKNVGHMSCFTVMDTKIQNFTLFCSFSLGAGTQRASVKFTSNPKSSKKFKIKLYLTFLEVAPNTNFFP